MSLQGACGMEVVSSSSFSLEKSWKNSVHQIEDLNLAVAIYYEFSFPEIQYLKQPSDHYLWLEKKKVFGGIYLW